MIAFQWRPYITKEIKFYLQHYVFNYYILILDIVTLLSLLTSSNITNTVLQDLYVSSKSHGICCLQKECIYFVCNVFAFYDFFSLPCCTIKVPNNIAKITLFLVTLLHIVWNTFTSSFLGLVDFTCSCLSSSFSVILWCSLRCWILLCV